MSADNGYVIRQAENGQYAMQMYFASDEGYPPIETNEAKLHDSLQDALVAYQNAGYSEYGLTVVPSKRKPLYTVQVTSTFITKSQEKAEWIAKFFSDASDLMECENSEFQQTKIREV